MNNFETTSWYKSKKKPKFCIFYFRFQILDFAPPNAQPWNVNLIYVYSSIVVHFYFIFPIGKIFIVASPSFGLIYEIWIVMGNISIFRNKNEAWTKPKFYWQKNPVNLLKQILAYFYILHATKRLHTYFMIVWLLSIPVRVRVRVRVRRKCAS